MTDKNNIHFQIEEQKVLDLFHEGNESESPALLDENILQLSRQAEHISQAKPTVIRAENRFSKLETFFRRFGSIAAVLFVGVFSLQIFIDQRPTAFSPFTSTPSTETTPKAKEHISEAEAVDNESSINGYADEQEFDEEPRYFSDGDSDDTDTALDSVSNDSPHQQRAQQQYAEETSAEIAPPPIILPLAKTKTAKKRKAKQSNYMALEEIGLRTAEPATPTKEPSDIAPRELKPLLLSPNQAPEAKTQETSASKLATPNSGAPAHSASFIAQERTIQTAATPKSDATNLQLEHFPYRKLKKSWLEEITKLIEEKNVTALKVERNLFIVVYGEDALQAIVP